MKGWIIGIFVGVVVIGGGFLGFTWYQARTTSGLSLEITVPEQVKVGIPFEAIVAINNNSKTVLQDSAVSLEVPEGMAFVGEPVGKSLIFKNIGSIGVGSINQERFSLIVVDGPNSVKRLKAVLNYTPASLGAKFEAEKISDVNVGEVGLKIDVLTPQKVFGGEEFITTIYYENKSDLDYKDLKMVIDYPPTFTFVKSTLPPDAGNREWDLGDLRKGSHNEFKITGSLVGPDNASFDINVRVYALFQGESYAIGSLKAPIVIAASPISLRIELNSGSGELAYPGDTLNYTIFYVNKTNIGLKDIILTAKLQGEMFDFFGLQTDAAYRSTDGTLTWNAANHPQLRLLEPGDAGSVQAILKVKTAYPIRRLSDRNFLLKLNAQIESPTVPYGVESSKTVGVARLETKVAGRTVVDAKGFFRDAASGIVNSGPFPPRVGKATKYTVHWVVTNYGTDVSGVEIKAFLGPNARFTGVAKSNTGLLPSYNDRTQEMIWSIDKLPATKGVISAPAEVIFQVEVTPSQAGAYAQITQDTVLKATDDFTGQPIQNTDSGVTTALPDDSTVSPQQGIVLP